MNELLSSKFNRPQIKSHFLIRKELSKAFLDGLNKKLTIISAPAGYGKSIFVSETLKNLNIPICWFSIELEDNDPVRFFKYFLLSLKKIDKNNFEYFKKALEISQLKNLEKILNQMINRIISIDLDFVLVLEDFHLIENPLIHSIIEKILNSNIYNIHMIIITRKNTEINVSKLKIENEISEFNINDFKLNLIETEFFFNKINNFSLNKSEIGKIYSKSEGWITGLQLIHLSLNENKNISFNDILYKLENNNYISDYIFDDLINIQKPNIYNFLIKTSIIESFNLDICKELIPEFSEKELTEIIEFLKKHNFFLISLSRGYYRYHHLLKKHLEKELNVKFDKIVSDNLHLKLSNWFKNNGYNIKAANHAIKGDKFKESFCIIENAAEEAIKNGEISSLIDLIKLFPKNSSTNRISVIYYEILALYFQGKLEEAEFKLKKLDERNIELELEKEYKNDKEYNDILGKIYLLKVVLNTTKASEELVEYSKKSIKLINPKSTFFYSTALLSNGWAESRKDNINNSINFFKESYFYAKESDLTLIMILSLTYYTFTLLKHLDFQKSKKIIEVELEYFKDVNEELIDIFNVLYLIKGMIKFFRNDLINAKVDFEKGLEALKNNNLIYIYCEFNFFLIKIYESLNEQQKIENTIKETLKLSKEISYTFLIEKLELIDFYIKFKNNGDILNENLITNLNNNKNPENLFFKKIYLDILIKINQLEKALVLAEELEKYLNDKEFYLELVYIYLFKTLIYYKKKKEDDLKRNLTAAIEIVRNENIIIPFLTYYSVLKKYFDELENTYDGFINEIKFHYNQDFCNVNREKLIEPLSQRELEILKLIASGNSNKKISEKLFITEGTTKWHIHNIYGKLGVNKRIEATNKAMELKLL